MPNNAIKTTSSPLRRGFVSLVQWFDTDYGNSDVAAIRAKPDKVEFIRVLPFLFLHLGCFGVLLAGWSWFAVGAAVVDFTLKDIHRRFGTRPRQPVPCLG